MHSSILALILGALAIAIAISSVEAVPRPCLCPLRTNPKGGFCTWLRKACDRNEDGPCTADSQCSVFGFADPGSDKDRACSVATELGCGTIRGWNISTPTNCRCGTAA